MHIGLLALSLLLSQATSVPLACAPGDSTILCKCKQGSASMCALLVGSEAEALKGVLDVAEMVEEKAKQQSTDVVDTGCGTSQDPNDDDQSQCTGQLHHIFSKAVWAALKNHATLKGLYRYRDPRFVARAKDLKAHCGWQNWHRDIDAEIAAWLEEHGQVTAQEFEAFLREVYARPELYARFPNGF